MIKYIAWAKIKNSNSEWEEDLTVYSNNKKDAIGAWEDTIDFFNDTLKPGESKRVFVKLLRIEEKEIPDLKDDDEFEDFEEFDEEDRVWED